MAAAARTRSTSAPSTRKSRASSSTKRPSAETRRTIKGLENELVATRFELARVDAAATRRVRNEITYAQRLLLLVAILVFFYVFLLQLRYPR